MPVKFKSCSKGKQKRCWESPTSVYRTRTKFGWWSKSEEN